MNVRLEEWLDQVRQAHEFVDSITKEQADAVLPLLSQEQQALLASVLRLGVEAHPYRL